LLTNASVKLKPGLTIKASQIIARGAILNKRTILLALSHIIRLLQRIACGAQRAVSRALTRLALNTALRLADKSLKITKINLHKEHIPEGIYLNS
jgi:hypothetical protein